jgi:prepilin-type N-terminal cleavage/methylation domain-containing protein
MVNARRTRATQGFTLIELVTVVAIVAVLAAIAGSTYNRFVGNARDIKASTQLGQLTTGAIAIAAHDDTTETLTRTMFAGGLAYFPDVTPGASAGGAGWTLLTAVQVPQNDFQFSVGFDNGIGTPMGDVSGTRAALVTRSGTGHYFALLLLASPQDAMARPDAFEVPAGTSAADVLGGAVNPSAPLPYAGQTPTSSPSVASPTPSTSSAAPAPSASSPTASPASTTAAPSVPSSPSASASAPPAAASQSPSTVPAVTTPPSPTTAPPSPTMGPTAVASPSPAASSASPRPSLTASASPTAQSPAPPSPSPTAAPAASPTSPPASDLTPVTVTAKPNTDWTTCAGAVRGSTKATVTDSYISGRGDSDASWSMTGPVSHVVGYKICQVLSDGSLLLLAATGPGTASARAWVVRTNQAHPNVYLEISTVFDDDHELLGSNMCETKPAGAAKGFKGKCATI